jgi:hypothetical protein
MQNNNTGDIPYIHPNAMSISGMRSSIDIVVNGFRRMTLDQFRETIDSDRPPIGGFRYGLNKIAMGNHQKSIDRRLSNIHMTYPDHKTKPARQQTHADLMNAMADAMEHMASSMRNGNLPWQNSFLANMLGRDSGATSVLISLMSLRDIWSVSKTSRTNAKLLGPDVQNNIDARMRKGCIMFYYFKLFGWQLAYVACVIKNKTKTRYAYHMTRVGSNATETLFYNNVATRTCISKIEPHHIPISMPNIYGNTGSPTAFQPHDLCGCGFYKVCCKAPNEFKSTAPSSCCMPTTASTEYITVDHIGTVIDLSKMLMIPQHAKAISKLESQRPYTLVNFSHGYSEEAQAAITNYNVINSYDPDNCINSGAYNDYGEYIGPIYGSNSFNMTMENLYVSMPFVARPITYADNYNEPPDAWSPGDPNPGSFHYLDNRSGNWCDSNMGYRHINWSEINTGYLSSDEYGDDDRDRRDY